MHIDAMQFGKKKTFLRRLSWEFGGRKLLILQRNFIVWKHKLYFCLGKVIYTLMNINAPFALNNSIKIVYLCISFFSFETDIDECQTDNHGCHSNSDCLNSIGSYTCQCKPGFTGSGFSCQCK